MKYYTDKVFKFQKAFGQPVNTSPKENIGKHEGNLRYELLKEENEEYKKAVAANDLTGVADALGDMLYVLCGTINAHGMQDIIKEIFDEIHRSNMTKLRKDGKPIYRSDGKVLKGKNYSPPDLGKILNK